MDIFDRAMRFEKAGALLYRQMGRKSTERGIKSILEWLADQEDKHYDIIRRMKAGGSVSPGRSVNWKGIKRIFKRMKAVAEDLDFSASQANTYRRALKVEEKSVKFYSARARVVKDGNDRKVLRMLADEERRHVVILENLIEFVSEPESWHEDAEFHRMGQY